MLGPPGESSIEIDIDYHATEVKQQCISALRRHQRCPRPGFSWEIRDR